MKKLKTQYVFLHKNHIAFLCNIPKYYLTP